MFVPCVIGPEDVPVVTRVGLARKLPELAMLSVIAHGKGPQGEAIARTALKAAKTIADGDSAALYLSTILNYVSAQVRTALETSMRNDPEYSEFVQRLITTGRAEGRAEGRAVGEVHGRAAALVAMLEARGLPLSKRQRKRIEASRDVEQLDHWIRLAVTAASVSDVLEG